MYNAMKMKNNSILNDILLIIIREMKSDNNKY